jgi:hypothetical protein
MFYFGFMLGLRSQLNFLLHMLSRQPESAEDQEKPPVIKENLNFVEFHEIIW